MTLLNPLVQRLLDESKCRSEKAAQERRDEFFAERRDIPDLEFQTPECPICGLSTDYDDGGFTCSGCEMTWPRNGYGHHAIDWSGERAFEAGRAT